MKWLCIALGVAAGACAMTERHMAQDDAKCASMGLPKGSAGYADCRMQLENNRSMERAALLGSN